MRVNKSIIKCKLGEVLLHAHRQDIQYLVGVRVPNCMYRMIPSGGSHQNKPILYHDVYDTVSYLSTMEHNEGMEYVNN
jgi:hypothetical protein